LFLASRRRWVEAPEVRPLLYPLWDAGWQVGHAVRTPAAAVEFADTDLQAATALLTARLIAGEVDLFEELMWRRDGWLRKNARSVATQIRATTEERHVRTERAGWALAPHLKEGAGGLRDAQAASWLRTVSDPGAKWEPQNYGVLMAAREALHGHSKRKLDRLRIDLQPAVAASLGFGGGAAADELMIAVHTAARTLEHEAADAASAFSAEILGGPRRTGSMRRLDAGVSLVDGEVVGQLGPLDAAGAMRLLAGYGASGRPVAPRSLEWAIESLRSSPAGAWSPELREAFIGLLRTPHASSALELLDRADAWKRITPEWLAIRGRAQHDHYHRYTVDGHSFVAVAEVSRILAEDTIAKGIGAEAGDLDALYLGALLHDVGKGSLGNHSAAGAPVARTICQRIGVGDDDIDDVVELVRKHLLLPDTATRRDLDDGAVIAAVADSVGSPRRLRLLYLLAMADGRATGPQAWTEWKATLVHQLFVKVLDALETGEVPVRSDASGVARDLSAFDPALSGRTEAVLDALPRSYLETPVGDMAGEIELLLDRPRPGEMRWRFDEGVTADQAVITICTPDRPGTLARSAGALSLNRISVLSARAYSTSDGMALTRFIVERPDRERLTQMAGDLAAVFSGRLALDARVRNKIRAYRQHRSGVLQGLDVRILNEASRHSTVVEVRAPDALGLLYAVAAGITDLDLSIHVAKIDTLGERVVDVFYTRTLQGEKLSDEQGAEVGTAIEHRIGQLFD
jgi:[protein-PII] uridylyltransferase